MALRQGRIGSIPDGIQYDDVDYSTSMEVEDPIAVNAAPTNPNEVVRLGDLGTYVWPVGSVFLSVISTNPNTLLGFGTWVRIAEGQLLVGFKAADPDFGVVEGTGGSKIAVHDNNHAGLGAVGAGGGHTHTSDGDHTHDAHTVEVDKQGADPGNILSAPATHSSSGGHTHNTIGTHAHSLTQPIAHSDHNILNPYFTIYAWKRTI